MLALELDHVFDVFYERSRDVTVRWNGNDGIASAAAGDTKHSYFIIASVALSNPEALFSKTCFDVCGAVCVSLVRSSAPADCRYADKQRSRSKDGADRYATTSATHGRIIVMTLD